jgi:hypothetical protein
MSIICSLMVSALTGTLSEFVILQIFYLGAKILIFCSKVFRVAAMCQAVDVHGSAMGLTLSQPIEHLCLFADKWGCGKQGTNQSRSLVKG